MTVETISASAEGDENAEKIAVSLLSDIRDDLEEVSAIFWDMMLYEASKKTSLIGKDLSALIHSIKTNGMK